jgi:hypothetical protein
VEDAVDVEGGAVGRRSLGERVHGRRVESLVRSRRVCVGTCS